MFKEALTNEELGTLLVLVDLMESHSPQPVLLGLFYKPSILEFFAGGFPPIVGLTCEVPASAIICTSCWVSNDLGDLPDSYILPASSLLLNSSCKGACHMQVPLAGAPSPAPP